MKIILLGIVLVATVINTVYTTTLATTTTERPEIRPKIIQSNYFEEENAIKAVVLKSNLPSTIQVQLATTLDSIYRSIADPMQRLQQFQTATTRLYPVYWNVVSNFGNITYYSQYYIYLQINKDRILAFGIS